MLLNDPEQARARPGRNLRARSPKSGHGPKNDQKNYSSHVELFPYDNNRHGALHAAVFSHEISGIAVSEKINYKKKSYHRKTASLPQIVAAPLMAN